MKFDEEYIERMWVLFLNAPAKKTLPGECVEFGEIGPVADKTWTKETPYSPAQMLGSRKIA